MKEITFETVDGYQIITGISNPTIDPERTREKTEAIIHELLGGKTIEQLYNENVVYMEAGANTMLVADNRADILSQEMKAAGEKRRVTVSGETIPYMTGTDYWVKSLGKWAKLRIENVGQDIPTGAILPENLSETQRKEISIQDEKIRIESLSEEELRKEMQVAIDSAADEADRLKRRADIQGKEFDETAYYLEKEKEIMAKYSITDNAKPLNNSE